MAKHTKGQKGTLPKSTSKTGKTHVPTHGGPQTGNGVGFTKRIIDIVFKSGK